MADKFQTALAMCQMMLKERAVTDRFLKVIDIQKVVIEISGMPSFSGVDQNRLTAELETRFTVTTDEHQTLGNDDDHKAWLPAERGTISWRYWDRYRLHLEETIPSSALESIDKVTNDVLERIESPRRPGAWDRRGLVMGHVQSGKTANYCGLICKAADAGYKVIIVLAGVHNSLRSQTQIRIDEGVLGFMSDATNEGQQTFKKVGVGLIDASLRANTGTNRTELGDFKQAVARQFGIHPGGLPLVFVVKKHVGVLENLFMWIRSCADAQDESTGRKFVRDVPALIIDDEADMASVDTKKEIVDENGEPDKEHDPTRTNKYIRLLLRSFEKVAYVGYTATPFANIYIHEKGLTDELGADIFPRSFLVTIPPPSNYMGPARVFGVREDEDARLTEIPALPIVRPVKDHAASDSVDETSGWMPPKLQAKTEHVPKYGDSKTVPPSLREAILAFILATAVRRIRETGPLFNSMLIHVVRYKNVQNLVKEQVAVALKEILQRLQNGDGERRPTILDEFQDLWTKDFVKTSNACREILKSTHLTLPPWKDVFPILESVTVGMRIKIINGSAGDILDYENHKETGMDVIAVGGDKLSRGLTLEGLTVSYFLRASRMYDTLMQMGRWFGYREKYIDVCRLYTTPELLEWFTHIAAASEELQREFEHMVSVGGSPKDYGIRVRSHPLMLVTSAVKMRHGTEMKLSYSGDISETIIFRRDPAWIKSNFESTETWLQGLGNPIGGKIVGGYTWHCRNSSILNLLRVYKSHPEARRADTNLLSKYIETQNDNGELIEWTVQLVSSGDAGVEGRRKIAGLDVGLIDRAPFPEVQRPDRYTIRRLLSPVDERRDLDELELRLALDLTIKRWEEDQRPSKAAEAPSEPAGSFVRRVRSKKKGLLLLYPLNPEKCDMPVDSIPILGLAISFPRSDTAREISYTVNNVFTSRGGDDESL
jgi:Z1 domain